MLYWYTSLASLLITTAVAFPLVISEVLWVGSPVSTADEWVELQVHPTFTGALLPLEGIELWANSSSGEPKLLIAFGSGDVLFAGSPYIVANYPAIDSALSIESQTVTTSVSLVNSKLLLWLQTASGAIIDTVDDGVGAPFAGGKIDGTFTSMERIDLTVSGQESTNWITAVDSINIDSGALVLATPGVVYSSQSSSSSSSTTSSGSSTSSSSSSSSSQSSNLTPQTLLYISEVLPNPVGSDAVEWIEIANTGSEAVLINDLQFIDTSDKQVQLTLSGATHLLPHTYTVFTKEDLGFTLKNSSGSVQLLQQGGVIDTLFYPEVVEGVSWGKAYSGAQLQPYCSPSPGLSNSTPTFTPLIEWQSLTGQWTGSGTLVATGSLTVNLKLSASGTMMDRASCTTQFSDGWESVSCNPASHKITQSGTGQIHVSITDYCGTTAEQKIEYSIYESNSFTNGGAQNATENIEHKCSSITQSGIRISEAFVNPIGDEVEGEWIELWNQNSHSVSLCGWQLDDAENGSKSFPLTEYSIPPNAYVVIPRLASGIALNNSNESVRLFAPSGVLVDELRYESSTENESLALRSDGYYVWTPFVTPGLVNQFRSVERRFESDLVVLNAALPNPDGKDSKVTEWVEITNVSSSPVNVTGWQLDDKPGGSMPYVIPSLWLDAGETKRFLGTETGLELANGYDEARLLDPDGYTNSVFSWQDAVSGYIYRLPRVRTQKVWAHVVECIDGDTFKIAFDEPDQLELLPDEVRRAWLAAAEDSVPSIPIRLLGIDTPETVHPFKPLEVFGKEASEFTCTKVYGKRIEVQFDEEVWDKYNRLLGYVFVHGELLQASLLQSGLATVYTRFPFARKAVFIAYESEARQALLGLWSKPEAVEYVQQQKDEEELIKQIEREGIALTFNPPSGRVQYGSGITITPSIPADVFVSVQSGAYIPYIGPIVVTGSVALRAYAQFTLSGTVVRSATGTAIYALEQSDYSVPVSITEVYPSPQKNEEEWIELYNSSSEPVDLGGYFIDDELNGGSKPYQFPLGTMLGPKELLVVPKSITKLSLSNTGDAVHLLDPNMRVLDAVIFAKTLKGTSVIKQGSETCVSDVASKGLLQPCITLSTDASAIDRDGDNLPDDHEQWKYATDPLNRDTDGDGYFDGFEVEAGLNPLEFTEPSRPIQLLYKKFIQKNVTVQFKQYKTVTDKLTITNKLPFVVTVEFASKTFTAAPNTKVKHELKMSEVGEYVVGVQLPDTLYSVALFDTVILNTIFVQKSKSTSKFSLPSWTKFAQKYVALGSQDFLTDGSMNALEKQVISHTRTVTLSGDEGGNLYLVCCFLFVFTSVVLSIFVKRTCK